MLPVWFVLLLIFPPLTTAVAARFSDVQATAYATLFALVMFALIIGNRVGQGGSGPPFVLLVSLVYTVFDAAVCSLVALVVRGTRRS